MNIQIKELPKQNNIWDNYFDHYDVLLQIYPYQKLLQDIGILMDTIICTQRLSSGVILDLGCGTGNLINTWLKSSVYPAYFRIYGLDNSEAALIKAGQKLNNNNIKLLKADINDLFSFLGSG